jgi:hypothetical protein
VTGTHSESVVVPALTVSGIGLLLVSVPNNPMSQSKSSYGAKSPKGTENEYCQHQNTSVAKANARAESVPEPACWRRRVDDWNWHETEFNAAFAGMYGSCPDCFDGGPPDVDEIERVVRSCSYPTTYHRVNSETDTREQQRERMNNGEETETTAVVPRFDIREEICDITDLHEGDGVVWEGKSTPLLVLESTTEADGVVMSRGPNGGEYRIEGRPNLSRPYYIRPGYAYQAEIIRVGPMDDQSRPEPKAI